MSAAKTPKPAGAAPYAKDDETEPLVVRPRAAKKLLQTGHRRLYELLNAGELESFKDGRSRKITMRSIRAYIDRKLSAQAGTTMQPKHGRELSP
jgi:hypothetical protein